MKNYLKKFSIMFVMLLAVIGFGIIQNGTVANAAVTRGDQLVKAEDGWTRYDDTDSRIKYDSHFSTYSSGGNNQFYWKDGIHTLSNNNTDKIKFKFYGSKIRMITSLYPTGSSNIRINIDGIDYSFSEYSSPGQILSIVFENKALDNKVHDVEINNKNVDESNISIDAIDIDDTGYLVPYDESIDIDESSLDLKVNESKQLTATTTPAGVGVTWTSSDNSIAIVDSNGKVTGFKAGTCTITATTADGSNLSDTCEVKVTDGGIIVDPPVNGDGTLFIELVDGNIKSYDVDNDEIDKFIDWYKDRANTTSELPFFIFTKGDYKDYVIHAQIDWFEVR